MGWSELLLIGVVALIVVGPKDLPVMFQSLGKMTAKVKRMAREFQHAMEDAADSTGMKDVAKDLNKTLSPKSMGIDKLREAADRFDKWDPTKKEPGPETQKLSEDREEAKRKIHAATSKAAEDRKAREAAAAASEAAELAEEPEPGETVTEQGKQAVNGASKPVTAAKAPAKKKPAAKKPAAKKAPAKAAAAPAPKTAAKKPAAKKPAARKTPAKSKPKPAASGDAEVS